MDELRTIKTDGPAEYAPDVSVGLNATINVTTPFLTSRVVCAMRITFIQITDEVHYEPMTASMAGLMKDQNWMTWHVRTDFATEKDAFVYNVRGNEPIALAFRVTRQTREIVEYLARAVAEGEAARPTFFYGPLCQTHPEEVVGMIEPSIILTGDPDVGLHNVVSQWPQGEFPMTPPPGCWYCIDGQVLRGDDGGPLDVTDAPKHDLVVFGGDRIFQRGTGASLFGELKVAPMMSGVGSPSGIPINNRLLTFSYPTTYPPRLVDPGRILFRMRSLGPRVHHYEFWDREFGHDFAAAERLLTSMHKRQKRKTYSLRVLASTFDERLLDLVDPRYFRRFILEYDAATSDVHGRIAGTEDPAKVEALAERIRATGHDVAFIVTCGLPFETADDIRRKIAFVRSVGACRVRFLPFEPRYGHPVYDICESEGMLEGRGPKWNREVWRPLRQESLGEEDWWRVWQECLDLQAEVQVRFPTDFSPTSKSA